MPSTPVIGPVSAIPRRSRSRALTRAGSTSPVLPAAVLVVLLMALLMAGGCVSRTRPLEPADLRADERQYLSRMLLLERVKATLLVDPARGATLADSLSAAWGDSARSLTLALAPTDPERAALVHEFLLRLLAAEQDSLLRHGGRRALTAPWPAPADSVPGAFYPGSGRLRAGD